MLAGNFFVVEIRDGRALVDLPEAIDCPGREQHGGNKLCLPASTMPDYSHVADAGSVVNLHRGIPPSGVIWPLPRIILLGVDGRKGRETGEKAC